MPRMTGYEAGRVLSQQPAGARPILIAITAWPRDSGKLEAEMLSGFDHYVGKSATTRPRSWKSALKRV